MGDRMISVVAFLAVVKITMGIQGMVVETNDARNVYFSKKFSQANQLIKKIYGERMREAF